MAEIKSKSEEKYYGRMNDCTTSAVVKGPCGDEMEVYLDIKKDLITAIKVFATGCVFTKKCSLALAKLADKKTIYEAMAISAKDVLDACQDIPEDHVHCNILAVSVLYRALGQYIMKKV